MLSGGTNDAIHAEQVRSSYAQLPVTLSVSVINACLLGFVLADSSAASAVLCWVGLILALSATRLCAWYLHRRQPGHGEQDQYWARLAVAGALASGVLWGSSILLVSPGDEPHQLFVALVIAGMCAGAATVHAAHFASVAGFIVPAILPLLVHFLWQGNRLQVVAGFMTGVFGIALCNASLRFRSWFRETTAARLSLARQAVALNQSNERLTTEIARHRATEAKLRHAQKLEAIGRLTAGVAHDFNNLLMTIGGSAGLIASRIAPDAPIAPRVRIIQQAVERGATLTRQLLAFGRKQTLMPRAVDVSTVLRGIEDLLTTTLAGHGKLALALDRQPTIAMVDPAQLEQAVLNLVLNARDAVPKGGAVTIRTRHVVLREDDAGTEGLSGPFVLISVADNGAGMSEEVRQCAFEPFFTTKEIGQGSGLGLSQVYGLVQQLGGTTVIDSVLGQGTTVRIYLPKLVSEAGDTTMAEWPASIASRLPMDVVDVEAGSRRVLVLDDEESEQGTIAAMLRMAGYSVIPVTTTQCALRAAGSTERIDAIMVALASPDLQGDQFATKVRRLRPGLPILFATGPKVSDALRDERWLLHKPFTLEAVICMLEQAMRVPA